MYRTNKVKKEGNKVVVVPIGDQEGYKEAEQRYREENNIKEGEPLFIVYLKSDERIRKENFGQ